MAFELRYSEEKNQILKATRRISFEEVIGCLTQDKLLDDKVHPDPSKSHQRIYIIQNDIYTYVVPYVIDREKQEIFLKTVYPSRKYTNKYIKKGKL